MDGLFREIMREKLKSDSDREIYMKVLAGKLKGRTIPFKNKKYKNADCTSQIVKGALFSSLGEDLNGKSFLDLYACSGQIGIEALSRGAQPVVLNEIDHNRYGFLKSLKKNWELDNKTIIYNYHAFRCLRYLHKNGFMFNYIYIDPPYEKARGEAKIYYDILEEIGKYLIFKKDALIIIQHFKKNFFQEIIGEFRILLTRMYANNSLSYFERVDK